MLCTELVSNENVKEVQTSHRPRDILLPDSSSRKDRDLVWKNREKIKETEHFKDAFFVPDLCKQDAEEGFKLRQALRCARNVFKMKVEIRNNRLLTVDSGISYSLQELPEYLKKELRQDK